MCGIVGFLVRPGAQPLDPDLVAAARDRMAHRGPDDCGLVSRLDGRLVLAHRRLSIQDLSAAGQQPMQLAGRDVWITYNGEVYNFPELRQRLVQEGAQLRSRTDTEVIVSLYGQLGDDVVSTLRGMFAFAIWDGERKRLLLVRDRIGKKPLYYAATERGLGFASTIEPLIATGWVDASLNAEALAEYLALGRVDSPRTLLDGVQKLPPGHMLVVEDGAAPRVVRYHEPEFREDGDPAALPDLLRESVAMRLISDVPVGVTLSGGVDSSLVAGLIAENKSVPLRTFTVAWEDGAQLNEAHYARAIADHLGAEHHEVWLKPGDVAEALPEIERHIDEPNPNLIWLATWFVCKLARENGVTVLLTGDGGDELFFGYSRWVALLRAYRRYLRPMGALPGPLRGPALAGVRALVRDEAARELFRRAARREPIYRGPMMYYPDGVRALLSPQARAEFECRPAPGATDDDFAASVRRVGMEGHLVEDFLARLDRMGMAVSVEGRAPLLDQKVVALATTLGIDRLVQNGESKAPLRTLVRELFPSELIDRPKMGFCAPVLKWLRGDVFELARSALDGLGEDIPLLDAAALEELRATPPANDREASRLWGLVSLSRWWRRMRSLRPEPTRSAPGP